MKKRIPVADRLMAKVTRNPATGCWIFHGAIVKPGGYGKIGMPPRRTLLAHRASYEAFVGPIPDGALIRHTCDTPLCINPEHLVPGTDSSNIQDSIDRGRWNGDARGRRGEAHSDARLTDADIREIRACPKGPRGSGVVAKLAAKFGVTKSMIHQIRRRAAWKHVR